MSLRPVYIYALLLAMGLFLWTEVLDDRSEAPPPTEVVQSAAPVEVWTSSEAMYECAMKAQEMRLSVEIMTTQAETMQGSLDLVGARENLKNYYVWLEDEGHFRSIDAFSFNTEDEKTSRLSVSYSL